MQIDSFEHNKEANCLLGRSKSYLKRAKDEVTAMRAETEKGARRGREHLKREIRKRVQ